VKLSSSICDDSTGAVADDALAAAMQQAAAQGLKNPQPLPTRCWYALEQQQQLQQPEQLSTGYAGRVGVATVATVSGGLLSLSDRLWCCCCLAQWNSLLTFGAHGLTCILMNMRLSKLALSLEHLRVCTYS
jgi:hypothetical protein